MKKIAFFVIVFLFLFSASTLATMMCGIIHTHTPCSDGLFTSNTDTLVNMTKNASCQFLVITDHGDMLKDNGCYTKEIEEAKKYTHDGFFVFIGREIPVGVDPKNAPDHLNAIAYTPINEQYLYDPSKSLSEVLDILASEGDLSHKTITIFNHPNQSKNEEWRELSNRFDCIETLNTVGGNILESKDSKYNYDLDIFLNQSKCVIGGADIHFDGQQDVDGIIRTYIFPEKDDYEHIFKAIRESSIATKNMRIFSINYPPNPIPYQAAQIDFRMVLEMQSELYDRTRYKAAIYKNNIHYKDIQLKKQSRGMKTYLSLSFHESIAGDEDSCYIIEVHDRLITSPICFTNNIGVDNSEEISQSDDQPDNTQKNETKDILRITNAYYTSDHQIKIELEDDIAFQSMRIYDICAPENFIYSSKGDGQACAKPFMSVFKTSPVSIPLGGFGNCISYPIEFFNTDAQCIEDLKRSFVRKIGVNDYRGVQASVMSNEYILLTEDSSVDENSRFAICDPDQPITLASDNTVIDCTEKYQIAGLEKPEGKTLYRLKFVNFFDAELLFATGRNYFILIKK